MSEILQTRRLWPNHALQRTASAPSVRASRGFVSARCAPPAPPRPSLSSGRRSATRRVMKTQDFTVTELVGCWRARRLVFCFDWFLRSDSTFTVKVSVLGIAFLRLAGTWSIDGDKLVSIYDKRNLTASGQKHIDRLLEVAQDYFILFTGLGTRRRWKRVYEKPVA